MNQNERRFYLISYLINEKDRYRDITVPDDTEGQRRLLRSLMNVRMPAEISDEFLQIQDVYLKEELRERDITDINDLTPVKDGIYLWQGDITTLSCDAIVNAANSQLLGCFIPCHKCIDNAIHTYAGIQLRNECASIIDKQGHEEETGRAKITKAYNLPCKYVIHTVGPIIYGKVRNKDEELLSSCYRSCLELADGNGLGSIAFCCISTGEFHFPNIRAAEIAIETVKKYKKDTGSEIKVIFNVYKDTDHKIYSELLR